MAFDTTAVERDLERITEAFETRELNDREARMLMRVLQQGMYAFDLAEPGQYEARWHGWARETLDEVLGHDRATHETYEGAAKENRRGA